MLVFKMDDCDFVAADSRDTAIAWYDGHVGPHAGEEGTEREIEEYELFTAMRAGLHPESQSFTFAEQIAAMQAAGETFPAVIAMDAHYA